MRNGTTFSKDVRGFSLVELLFAAALLALIMGAVIGVQSQAKFMQRDSDTESRLFLEGTRVLNRIERGQQGLQGLMKSRSGSIAVVNNNRQIDFQVDTNAEYTSTTNDDTGMSIYFDNGDGDDNSFADNTIVLDTDTADPAAGTLLTVARNVENVQFQFAVNTVTVSFTITAQVAGQDHRLNMTRDIYVRN